MSLPSTVIIGAGISGLACARAAQDGGLAARVLDRGRSPGGRMSGRELHGRFVDLGASYLTASDGSPFAALVADWVERGLARPWTDTFAVAGADGVRETRSGPLRYGAPGGLQALVADLATGLAVTSEHTVERVGPGPTVDGEDCDTVVFALPDPQAERLLAPGLPTFGAREWQPALAVVLGWSSRRWPADLHGAFVHDSPVLEWLADDGDRRGDGAPVLVAHTTAAFARGHLEHPEGAAAAVAAATCGVLGIDDPPEWTHVHRWTFAKPVDPREQPYGLEGGHAWCGDGWAAPSRVSSAWTSGDALGRQLARRAGA